ncbi:Uncharacterised protein [Mycobacterium tuberculosis]|uniref:Uncharacterized protein n=1 Tax=Mycobacterium tuberculosis TaxID=1773 RepID=A0A654T8H2_MYCTX|nr:Uncharacterised protein [Mycobacterium tuberculosis]CNM33207.1 Uncharacterised protein [Mycobacterium tuberculosis]SGO55520.1 Uncharacterised protein [Mycobacterium tuberculosis]
MRRNAERQFAAALCSVASLVVPRLRCAVTVPPCSAVIATARCSHGSIGWSADSNANTNSPPPTDVPAFSNASAGSNSRQLAGYSPA